MEHFAIFEYAQHDSWEQWTQWLSEDIAKDRMTYLMEQYPEKDFYVLGVYRVGGE